MNDKKIVRKEYTEMVCLANNIYLIIVWHNKKNCTSLYFSLQLNLLEIWCCHQQFVNVAILKDDLVKAFLNTFSLGLLEMEKFRDFLITCFSIFNSLNNTQIDNLILKCLQDNLNKTKSIVGAFMLEYLLNRRSRSEPLLKSLQTPDLMKLQNFLENNSTKKQQVTCITKDLHVFRDAFNKTISKSKEIPAYDVHCSKRPRVSKGDCCITDYKLILNEIFENSRKLAVNTTPEVFDTKDYELLNCIKQNIEICLRK